jgi:hypothetical protein
MTITITEYRQKLALADAEMLRTQAGDALLSALDLLALIKRRIQTKGQNYNNVSFSPYTKAHKKVRQNYGAQTEKVDFTMTGRLMANITPIVEKTDGQSTTININARTSDNQVKIAGAIRKRGNILTPSEQEKKIAVNAYVTRRVKRLKSILQ